jgi:hypothetical protein
MEHAGIYLRHTSHIAGYSSDILHTWRDIPPTFITRAATGFVPFHIRNVWEWKLPICAADSKWIGFVPTKRKGLLTKYTAMHWTQGFIRMFARAQLWILYTEPDESAPQLHTPSLSKIHFNTVLLWIWPTLARMNPAHSWSQHRPHPQGEQLVSANVETICLLPERGEIPPL